ncbi:tagaturonate reductase [Caldifermentibacillus hisashii]|uniref:tagaturonate reductase n=1 Tax=Caldifermentibacillus hisashii TaxID=996558 RepID=UPI0031FC2CB6
MERLSEKLVNSRKQHPEKILQFGEGNFLRGFVDWQIDVMNKKNLFNGSVVIIQPQENGLCSKLDAQDGLYTLYLQGIKNGKAVREHELIESISRCINPYTDYDKFMEVAKNPELKFITSNTTEAGICFNDTDRLEDRPQKSFPGKLTAFLYRRYQLFNGDKKKGFIIIPCELIEKNGEKLKSIVLQYTQLWNLEEEFISWINEANIFCSSLVDRIVPGFPKNNIRKITEELGYVDDMVVVGEQYHLWVIQGPKWIEQEFPAPKAGLNTIFVDDITPYRTRKVRILNGAHTAMTPVAYLYGLETVDEAIEHPVIGQYVKELIYEEIIATINLPILELHSFAKEVIDRFKNPFVEHFLMSIALNSISKYKTRNLPTLLDYYQKNQILPKRLVFSFAALIEFYKGKRGEEPINLADNLEIINLFKDEWSNYKEDKEILENIVKNILGKESIWGSNLNEIPGLTLAVTDYLYEIETKGIREAVEGLIEGT